MSEVQSKVTPMHSARNLENTNLTKCGDGQVNDSLSSPKRNPIDEVSERFSQLEKRRQSLGRSMRELRQQIAEEKELWRKEIDLILAKGREKDMSITTGSDIQIPSSTQQIDSILYRTQIAKIDSASNNILINSSPPNTSLQEVPTRERSVPYEVPLDDNIIRDYESKISRYQEILAATQAENKNSVKKQLVANAFRRRLQEVENMCTVELMRVRQNISALQPLQNLLSNDWTAYNQDMDSLISEQLDDICRLPDRDMFSNTCPNTDVTTDFQCMDIVENTDGNTSIFSSNDGSLSGEENNQSIDITLEQ